MRECLPLSSQIPVLPLPITAPFWTPTLFSGWTLSCPGPPLSFSPWVPHSILLFFPILSRAPPLFSPLGSFTLTLLPTLALCPSQPNRSDNQKLPSTSRQRGLRRVSRLAGLGLAAKLGKCRLLELLANESQGRDRGSGAGSGEATEERRVAAPGLEQLPEPLDGPPPLPRHGRE